MRDVSSHNHESEAHSSSSASSLETPRSLSALHSTEAGEKRTSAEHGQHSQEDTARMLLQDIKTQRAQADSRGSDRGEHREEASAVLLLSDFRSQQKREATTEQQPDHQEVLTPTAVILGRELRAQQSANGRGSEQAPEERSNFESIVSNLWIGLGEYRHDAVRMSDGSTPSRAMYLPDSLRNQKQDTGQAITGRVVFSSYDAQDLSKFHLKQDARNCAAYSAYHFARSMGMDVNVKDVEKIAVAQNLGSVENGKINGMYTKNSAILLEKHLGIEVEYNKNTTFSDIEKALNENKAVYVSVNSGILWNNSDHLGNKTNGHYEANHAIIVTGLIRDAQSGKTVGVLINDSSSDMPARAVGIDQFKAAFALRDSERGPVGKSIISKEKRPPFEEAYYGRKTFTASSNENYRLAA